MARNEARLTIGQIADRTGLSISAIRFYETKGLVTPLRNAGGQRRFRQSDIRRLSFVLIAQQLGFSLEDVGRHLAGLPNDRAPNKQDWTRISRSFRSVLRERIDIMTRMLERLDGCIGCGCLSLASCSIYNPDDKARRIGTGPRYLLQD